MTKTINPNESLGKEIFEALAEQGLVNTAESANLLKQLSEGTVKASDWKLAMETAIRKPQNPASNETANS